ncbi:Similar to hypothetical protein [Tuber melanosporum Mel28]; acc. no. XP_002837646 [Pyronema omphalodes CBS 100304]|uniref:Uncharacterized protein n=1 Tax=Pyronema omphalodes (strain CBS 100304) TaxID=1076935 RepID=U4LNB8_PYROM|nr:Similar to hypothetical protein [Tuber melanosporum Mel28]; acc. no. XP_002837646 [Pyronema omphalodes CBS 100304]
MPGLNPLQNAQPRQQIPNEAPQYFSPFFEQPAKPPPVSIWQPPNVDLPLRSKAPTHRPRSPPKIPTAGTWSRKNSRDVEKEAPKGLFQPRQKKSVDEIMWLGAVAGFPLPEPAPLKEQRSLRSKLVRRPEEIPSQASSATGPKATEAQRKKDEEAKARERRLEEWATKKKPNVAEKPPSPSGMAIPIPQPIESRLRPRKKVYTPLPQPEEAALISNRPNMIHRPHLPSGEGSFAPDKPFLPQPVETVRKTNRTRPTPKKRSQEEETLWMGSTLNLPQPIETTKRSTRRSPLNKMVSADEYDGTITDKEPRSETNLPDSSQSQSTEKKEFLPQPIETSRRSNRPAKEILPEPIESTRRSNRPSGSKPSESKEILPEPIETTRRSNRPSASDSQREFPSPVPIETTRRSNRPGPSPIQRDDPPTPTTSFFGPDITPQPIETTKRSYRPITARPLVPQFVESSMRSSRMRIPYAQMHLELPQPISVSRWTSRSPGLRRESTSSKPTSPGVHPFSRGGDKARRKVQKFAAPAADHVWHLEEPVDSAPTSPVGSPTEGSPVTSTCPSLSSSPTSCATSMAWDIPTKLSKITGQPNQARDLSSAVNSLEDERFSGYAMALEEKLKQDAEDGILTKEDHKASEGVEYPFPVVITESGESPAASTRSPSPNPKDSHTPHRPREDPTTRSESSETIRPKLRQISTEPLSINTELNNGDVANLNNDFDNEEDDYPICHSPRFEKFEPPILCGPDTADEFDYRRKLHIPTMWKPSGGASTTTTLTTGANPRPGAWIDNTNSLRSGISKQHAASKLAAAGQLSVVGRLPSAPPRMWSKTPGGPSPGYTVASLPPTKRQQHSVASEVTKEFVEDVWKYLGLQFENVAAKFDPELAQYTGLSVVVVKRDRKAALRRYCEKWVGENPEGEVRGLW